MGLFDLFKSKPTPAAPTAPAPAVAKTPAYYSAVPQMKPGVTATDLMRGIYDSKDAGENYSMELLALKGIYERSYWIRRCVNIIAQAGSKKFELIPRDPAEAIDPAKVARLLDFLNQLNDTDTFESFFRKCLINLQVYGFFICEVVNTSFIDDEKLVRETVTKAFTQAGRISERLEDLQPEIDDVVGRIAADGIPFLMRGLPSHEMEITTDSHGAILEYIQRPRTNPNAVKFQPNQVWHVVHPNSDSGTYGDSQIGPLSDVALIDRYIDLRQKNKLASDNALDTLVTLENGTQGLVEALGRELQTKYGGPNGIRTFVADGSIKIEDISKIKEGDFLKTKEMLRDTVCLALGVPLGILGVTDGVAGKGSGADEHQRNFIENTVRPLVQYLEAAFNRHVLSMFANIDIDYIVKIVLEDTDDAGPLELMYDTAVRNGTLTPNEKRAQLNLPPYKGYGDVALVTAGGTATPLPALENPPPPPAPVINKVGPTEPMPAKPNDNNKEADIKKATEDAHRVLRELRKAV